MNETEFLRQVLDLARLLGWRSYHPRPGRTQSGWRTPVQGDGIGWPDLFLVRGSRAVAVELKAGRGSLSHQQGDWLTALQLAGIETHVWRPQDFDEAVSVLR